MPEILLDRVCVSFGDQTVLDRFSYRFAIPGLYLLTGQSGSGKTTLLRLLAGLCRPDSGTVTFPGKRSVSMHFQEYRLFPTLTALANAALVLRGNTRACRSRAAAMLGQLGFSEEDLGKFPHQLSGGMQQRVSLARAFLNQAPLLLLDEPTKELDAPLRAAVCRLIGEEARVRAVVLATHNPDELAIPGGVPVPVSPAPSDGTAKPHS